MKHKLFLSVLLLFALCISSTGCNHIDYINDANGTIESTDPATVFYDGTYSAHYAYYDSNGFGLNLQATVKNGILVSAQFDETNQEDISKTDLDAYATPWPNCADNVLEIHQKLCNSFVHNQAITVDTISGATMTSNEFTALSDALYDAFQIEGEKDLTIDNLSDTYTAEKEQPTDPNRLGQLSITFIDNTIDEVTYKEYTSTGEKLTLSSNDYDTLCGVVQKNNTLEPLSLVLSSVEKTTYFNSLLADISAQRVSFTPN